MVTTVITHHSCPIERGEVLVEVLLLLSSNAGRGGPQLDGVGSNGEVSQTGGEDANTNYRTWREREG